MRDKYKYHLSNIRTLKVFFFALSVQFQTFVILCQTNKNITQVDNDAWQHLRSNFFYLQSSVICKMIGQNTIVILYETAMQT